MASGLHEKQLVFVMGSAQKEEVPEAQLQGKQTKINRRNSHNDFLSNEYCTVYNMNIVKYTILAS